MLNMTAAKEQRIEVFKDTGQWIQETETLSDAVTESIQKTVFYEAAQYPEITRTAPGTGTITVTKHRSFEAAMLAHADAPDAKIAVLNFASATNPGGGVAKGSSAQEECLCRCSTLYPVLKTDALWQSYYGKNRAKWNPLHTDDCIYSPGIVICKSDTGSPERLPEAAWVTVDVISCAAPNLRQKPGNIHNPEYGKPVRISKDKLRDLHQQRAKHILHIAAANEVDILILGAFGCGAFANDPETVASAMRDAAQEYRSHFQKIEFAVYCGPRDHRNYDIFRTMIGE